MFVEQCLCLANIYFSSNVRTVMVAIREGRLRHHLGARYDSRSGVYDWDYHMKLQEMVTVKLR